MLNTRGHRLEPYLISKRTVSNGTTEVKYLGSGFRLVLRHDKLPVEGTC
jgi:hypothetical protein